MNNFCTAETEDGQMCGAKSENRDLGLCATHNKARIKAEKPPAVPPQRKPLQRVAIIGHVGSTGANLARAVIRQVSDKKRVALVAKKQAYAVVDAGPRVCVSCGTTERLTHSHVLTVGQFPQHEANPVNILLECAECHTIWEHNKAQAKRIQASWGRKMAIMQQLEPAEFARFQAFNPHLFQK